MLFRSLLTAAALTLCGNAQAVTVFSDDFDADALALSQTNFVGGWTVSDGFVDVIGPGFFDFFPGNGNYIDLDGTGSDAGVFSRSLALAGGVTYSASFVLAGSARGDVNRVVVSLGTALAEYTLASNAPFLVVAPIVFTPITSGDYVLSFANDGGDDFGAILDNVQVQALPVPEPETYALMLGGLAAMGTLLRRRSAR